MKLFVKSIAFLALATFASVAHGQNTIWRNVGNDPSFENPFNWNNGIPTAGLNAYVVPDGIADASGAFLVTQGGTANIIINASTSHTSAGLFITSDVAEDLVTGTVTMTFASGTSYAISGNLGVRDGEALIYTGNMSVGGFVNIGTAGNGSFTLSNGTLDNSAGGGLFIGSGAGNSGSVTQAGSSVIEAGQVVEIGQVGTGSYVLNAGSTLVTSTADNTVISIGSNGGTGSLALNNSSSVILNSGTDMQVGTGTGLVSGGSGVVTQAGSGTAVVLNGTATLEIGAVQGGSGTYNLEGGVLTIGTTGTDTAAVDIGVAAGAGGAGGSTGSLNQTGGTLTALADTSFTVGDAGIGLYRITAGTADFQNGITVGAAATGSGTILQAGGTITVENAPVSLGVVGTGVYQMEGGSATFGAGITVGATGSIGQTGGTIAITGGTLDLSAIGSSYTLGGSGVLQINSTALVGTSGAGANNAGTFNFGGGTLQVTSGGVFTDGLNGTLTGNSTIDAATTPGITTVNLLGVLGGGGGLTLVGSAGTTFNLGTGGINGVDSFSGTTTIASGTLNTDQPDIASSTAINIGSTATVNLTLSPGGFSDPNSLQGGGLLNVNFGAANDTFIIKDTSAFTGSIVLGNNATAGTLQVFRGHFTSISDNGSGSSVLIGGASALANVPTTGTVTLDSSTYTGQTTVGTGFTLNAQALGGALSNSTGATVFALGAGGDVTNNGTLGLSKNSAIGSTFNINGALTTGANSGLIIRASGTGATPVADSFVATGAGNIDSSTTIKVTGAGNIVNPIAIVTANGGLTIAPNALPILKTGLLFQATLTVAGDSIFLTAVQNPLGDFALTPNEAATAVPIDQAVANNGGLTIGQQNSLNHILLPLNNLPTAQLIAKALEQLSPETLQYTRNIAFENSTFLVQKMDAVDANLRSGYGGLDTSAISVTSPIFNTGLGHSMQGLLASDSAFHQSAPNGVNYYPGGGDVPSSASMSPSGSPSHPSSAESTPPEWNPSNEVISDSPNPYLAKQNPSSPIAPAINEFISGDAVLADLNQNSSANNAPSSSASYTAASATGGVSFRMNSHLAAGVLFDYNHTDARTDDSGSKTKVDSYSPGLFATYFDHGFYANGLFAFGYNQYASTRNLSTFGESASSHPSGEQYVVALDGGYDFHPAQNWVVGPLLGLTYTHLDVDSFQETGAPGADLNVESQSADSLRSRLGGHVIFQTNTGNVLLQPNFMATWQHEFLDNSDGITSTFRDFSSTPFTINTAAPQRDSALLGLGLTATLDNSLAFYFNYFADVGFNDYFAQSVVGGFKARF